MGASDRFLEALNCRRQPSRADPAKRQVLQSSAVSSRESLSPGGRLCPEPMLPRQPRVLVRTRMLGTEQEAPLYEVCPRGIDHGVVERGSCPWLVITRCEKWAERDSQRAQVA